MNNNLIDMHTHTSASDGEYDADTLIEMAKDKGITTLGITDHDTLLGVQGIKKEHSNIEVVPGIEISVKVPVGRMHVLGYDLDIWNENLNKKMEELHNRSLYSVAGVICQLKKDYGIVLDTEDILSILNKKTNIGRPDIARVLVDKGITGTVREAFDKYLVEAYEKVRDVAKGISKKECIELIKNANGLAVIAHPHSLELSPSELDTFIEELVSYGLDGIEVYHSNHNEEMVDEYLRLAEKYDLLISGGSDYHGPVVKPDVGLGTGKDNIKIKKLSLLDEIHKRKKN